MPIDGVSTLRQRQRLPFLTEWRLLGGAVEVVPTVPSVTKPQRSSLEEVDSTSKSLPMH